MKLPISRYTVHGNSMFPTLKEGQDVLSRNWFVNPKVGDIVIVRSEKGEGGREIVKRIIKISRSKIFVEGDNKKQSTDSRDFGAINMENIVGKVIYKGSHPELDSGSINMIDCPNCGFKVLGIYGRKDAICSNCGFKLICCGE